MTEAQQAELQRKIEADFRSLFPEDERPIVFGDGRMDGPAVMLIGEAPGKDEVLQGRPFVGKAGKNLDEFLQAVELERADIRISNVVKVRPVRVSPKGTVANRPPNREELAFFIPYLYDEIMLTGPQLIVTLGNTALQALLGSEAVIGDLHGRVVTTTVMAEGTILDFDIFPLYHPASIIYNRSLKDVYAADLLALRDVLRDL